MLNCDEMFSDALPEFKIVSLNGLTDTGLCMIRLVWLSYLELVSFQILPCPTIIRVMEGRVFVHLKGSHGPDGVLKGHGRTHMRRRVK